MGRPASDPLRDSAGWLLGLLVRRRSGFLNRRTTIPLPGCDHRRLSGTRVPAAAAGMVRLPAGDEEHACHDQDGAGDL